MANALQADLTRLRMGMGRWHSACPWVSRGLSNPLHVPASSAFHMRGDSAVVWRSFTHCQDPKDLFASAIQSLRVGSTQQPLITHKMNINPGHKWSQSSCAFLFASQIYICVCFPLLGSQFVEDKTMHIISMFLTCRSTQKSSGSPLHSCPKGGFVNFPQSLNK